MAARPEGYGIFGGLFDPPHIGHLIIAQHVREEFNLRKIIFVPSGQPPHKGSYTSFIHRYRMTRMAIAGNPGFSVSAVERGMRGTTYTVEVLRKIERSLGRNLFLIIGADQWEEIGTWKDPAEIFRIARVIVVPRPGHRIIKHRSYSRRLLISASPMVDLSSTRIRRLAVAGRKIKYLTPDPVIRYISAHRIKDLWRRRHDH